MGKSKDKSPAFQLYPGDWLSSADILVMTSAQEGAYFRLLCIAWMSDDCGLPDDDEALATLSRLGPEWFNGGGTIVRNKFFSKNKRLFNKRQLKERKKQKERSKLCSASGVASGRARQNKRLSGERTFNERSTNVERKGNSLSSSSFSSSVKDTTTTTEEKILSSLPPDDGLAAKAKEVIEYLNKSTGSRFRPTGKNVDLVKTRLKEGFTIEDFATVIEGQKLDPWFLEHPKYFRPSTLFGSKFESYLSAAPKNRMALERDPKKMIKDMRVQEENRRFIQDGDESKQIEGGEDGRQGPRRLRE